DSGRGGGRGEGGGKRHCTPDIFKGAIMSISKPRRPPARCSVMGRSRLVHVVRTTKVGSAGRSGWKSRLTRLRYRSVPASPSRSECRRDANQNAWWFSRVRPCRKEKNGWYSVILPVVGLILRTASTE